jgi:nucleoside phosphorylase/CheY-like chemotaxis protein
MTERILIVDDDPQKASLISRVLEDQGVPRGDIFFAENASEARIALRDRHFDLLLLDVLLPARQGGRPSGDVSIDFLREIIEDGTSAAPAHIIAITADPRALAEHEDEFRRLTTLVLHVAPGIDCWSQSLGSALALVRATVASRTKFDFDVCFQTALRVPELSELYDSLPCDWSAEKPLTRGILFRSSTLEVGGRSLNVVAAHSSSMGLLPAYQLSTCLMRDFRPRVLVMSGVCGGLAGAKLGDVVVADRSWDWQCGKWDASGNLQVAPDQREGSPELIALAHGAQKIVDGLFESYSGDKPATSPKILVGPMVSGSSVVSNSEFHTIVRRQHRKTLAIDMECYATYYAVSVADEPRPMVLCVKAVSDLADAGKQDAIQPYCSRLSAEVIVDVVRRHFAGG